MVDFKNWTEQELTDRHFQLTQQLEGWTTEIDNRHVSEVEDEVKRIEEELKKFE